jgi:hypothetical protein
VANQDGRRPLLRRGVPRQEWIMLRFTAADAVAVTEFPYQFPYFVLMYPRAGSRIMELARTVRR